VRTRAMTVQELPQVDRTATKEFRKDLKRSDQYFKFGKTQMDKAMKELLTISGDELLGKVRENGFRLTVGDVTFVLAETYGFCWGVERSVAMAHESRNYFPDKTIWLSNEIIHNPKVNKNLEAKAMRFLPVKDNGAKDYSGVQEGDVVVLPAFGASVDEMAFFQSKNVQIVDTTCPWVSKVWNSVEKSKEKGFTSIIHGQWGHEETVATKSFASCFLVIKDMQEAEYVADYILGNGTREDFFKKFHPQAMSEGFDPDVDLKGVGVANQTTMMKGETELIGKLFERTMIKKYGPQDINSHFVSFNTICDATQFRQDAMYKMFNSEYEAPSSELYTSLQEEQSGVALLSEKKTKFSSKTVEDATRGASKADHVAAEKIDICLVVGGFNSSNTTHLLEIAEEEGVRGYHVDCAERIGGVDGSLNQIEHKPLRTSVRDAMLDSGLEISAGFLSDGPVTIGLTSGASTPDNVLGDVVKRVLALRGLSVLT